MVLSIIGRPGTDRLMLRISYNLVATPIVGKSRNRDPASRHLTAFSMPWRTGEPDAVATLRCRRFLSIINPTCKISVADKRVYGRQTRNDHYRPAINIPVDFSRHPYRQRAGG